MIQRYTDFDLLKYYYKELDLFHRLEMEFAMENDSMLIEDYLKIQSTLSHLPRVTFSPNKKVIDNVLAYSKA